MTPEEAYESALGKALTAALRCANYEDEVSIDDYPQFVTVMKETLKDNGAWLCGYVDESSDLEWDFP